MHVSVNVTAPEKLFRISSTGRLLRNLTAPQPGVNVPYQNVELLAGPPLEVGRAHLVNGPEARRCDTPTLFAFILVGAFVARQFYYWSLEQKVNRSMASLLRGVAFITGAGSGIGQYAAFALARHGVKQFAICDIRPDVLNTTSKELKSQNEDVEVLHVEMDTSKEDSVQSAIDQTVKKFGRLDIALNNAGIGGTPAQTEDETLSEWQRVMEVNVNGVWLCQRAEIRQMLKQEPLDPPPRGSRGVIVNTASMLGLAASSPVSGACKYTASKHAVMGLTKTDAIAYAPKGIRINAICPGYVGTPLLKQATASGVMDGEIAKVPQGRLGEMEEIADSIMFLASPLSSFMCGSGLVVDGGFTAGCY